MGPYVLLTGRRFSVTETRNAKSQSCFLGRLPYGQYAHTSPSPGRIGIGQARLAPLVKVAYFRKGTRTYVHTHKVCFMEHGWWRR